MANDYEKITRTELHRLQEKRNDDKRKIDILFQEAMIQYVIIFIVAASIDPIARVFHLRFQPGIGWEQIAVMAYCLVQILRLYKKR